MHRKALMGLTAALAATTVLTVAPSALAGPDSAPTAATTADDLSAIGLTRSMRLVQFDVDNPASASLIGVVTGLQGDTKLVGIDYRVQNGLLYGVGNAGGVYTLDDSTAVATKVSQLTVALSGTTFGVDFNPAADRLRVVSSTGQNLRHDLTAGLTTVDVSLIYPPATTTALGVNGSAYSNNDLDPNTATTLYDIDTTLNQVALQSPANSGTLAPTGLLTVDPASDSGFDIYSDVQDGTTTGLSGWATLSVGGTYHFYEITLFSGRATDMGAFALGVQVFDVAVPLAQ